MPDLHQWVIAAIATLSFVWNVVTYARANRGRKRAEQAEQAGRLLELMNRVGLGGATVGLDTTRAQELHDIQVQRLQQVVRVGVVDFTARALRPGTPWTLLVLFVFYAGLFVVAGMNILSDSTGMDSLSRSISASAALVLFTLAAVTIWGCAVAAWRRWVRWSQQLAAGIEAPTAWQTFRREWRDTWRLFGRWREERARLRRYQR